MWLVRGYPKGVARGSLMPFRQEPSRYVPHIKTDTEQISWGFSLSIKMRS